MALTVIAGPDLWQVKADPGQMEQVVMNILVNARDAMPHGGKVLLEMKNIELDDGYAQNTRRGNYRRACPVGHLRHRLRHGWLGPQRASSSHSSRRRALPREPDSASRPYSESSNKAAATSRCTAKLAKVQRSKSTCHATRAAAISTSPRIKETVRGGRETILLVEDEEGVRTLAQTVLQGHGYIVLDAKHGGDALMICETRTAPINLMITDVVMPHFSGRQLAWRLASRQPTMKVLFMSGYTDDAIVHHGVLESGMPFLQKPFSPEALARKVREVLDAPTFRKE